MNLTALAARGRSRVEDAIATSGTKVTISRDDDDLDAAVDLATLTATDPTPPRTIATGVAALIITAGDTATPAGPNREEHPPGFRVLLPVAVTDVRERDLLTVTATRDRRLAGATLLVTAVADDALGIVRTVQARRT